MLKRIFFIGIILATLLQVNAQSTNALKQGDTYFQNGEYYNAILNYEIYLGLREAPVVFAPYANNKKKKLKEFQDVDVNKPNAINVFYNLGQSYKALNDFSSSEKWFNKVIQSRSNKFPLARLNHGITLRALGRYKDAEKELKRFIKENEANTEAVATANSELNNINYIRQQVETRKPAAYALHKLKGTLNQTEGAYAPVIMGDTLLFTSARIVDTVNEKFSRVNSHVNHLFYNTINIARDSVIGKASLLKFASKTSTNEGTPTFSPLGTAMYFTRWESSNGKTNSAIYVSNKKNDSTWQDPIKLDEKVNKAGYNSNQPFVTPDGKYLLYASDRPDGVGKYDIWAAPLVDTGGVGEPLNLANINTKEDDKAPFYHAGSKTLVFSSNGRVGMGGFDLYSASGDITNLQTPVNMGGQINSVKDDNYFFSVSKDTLLKRAYVSSDRASQCCLEIFSVERLPKKIFKQRVDGLLSDGKTGQPLPNTSITINNAIDSAKSKHITTDSKGLFLVDLNDSISGLTLSKKGYDTRTQPFRYDPELYADTTYLVELFLNKAKKVFYKQHLNATVVDCETKKPISKAYITVLNSVDTTKNFVVSSNATGNFSVDINDSINGFWFEKKAYFDKDVHFSPQSDVLESDTTYTANYCMEKWKPEENPTAKPVEITDPTIVNKVVETINKSDSVTIYFDFNSTELKPEAVEVLDKLLAILKTYPTISLELDISGHTDAKGSDAVNLKIGRGRALSCLGYMIQKGISESRLKLKSYGKSLPAAPDFINHKDNPEGRAKNRRVIMKVRAKVVNEKK